MDERGRRHRDLEVAVGVEPDGDELLRLAARSSGPWQLSRALPGVRDSALAESLCRAGPLVTVRHEGDLVGAAALSRDHWHSTLLGVECFHAEPLAAIDDAVRVALLRACMSTARMHATVLSYMHPAGDAPAGVRELGFSEFDHGTLLVHRVPAGNESELAGTSRVRSASAADLPEVRRIIRSGTALPESLHGSEALARAVELEESLLDDALRRPGTAVLIEEDDATQRLAGTAVVMLSGEALAHLQVIAVDECFRNRGVGSRLVAASLAWTRLQGRHVLSVATRRGSAGQAFHEQRGAVRVGDVSILHASLG